MFAFRRRAARPAAPSSRAGGTSPAPGARAAPTREEGSLWQAVARQPPVVVHGSAPGGTQLRSTSDLPFDVEVGDVRVSAVRGAEPQLGVGHVRIPAGTATLDARVGISTAPGRHGSVEGWSLGLAQMVGGVEKWYCYRQAEGSHVVARLRTPGHFVPDRDHRAGPLAQHLWSDGSLRAAAATGERLPVHFRDSPALGAGTNLLAYGAGVWGEGGLGDLRAAWMRGDFVTYVVLRDERSGVVVPVYVFEWFLRLGYVFGREAPHLPVEVEASVHQFGWIDHHPYGPSDLTPVLDGEPLPLLDVPSEREVTRTRACPSIPGLR